VEQLFAWATTTISQRPFSSRAPNGNTVTTSYHRLSLLRKPDISASTRKALADTMLTLILRGRSETEKFCPYKHTTCFKNTNRIGDNLFGIFKSPF
jgi:hypothetical protein